MIDFSEIELEAVCVHQVGNKLRYEELQLADKELTFTSEETKEYLLKYFLASFKSDQNEVFNFTYPTDINLNDAYIYVKRIFDSSDSLLDTSKDIARHLYEKSSHPKINEGEFCVSFFKNCIIDGERTNAIGFFKSEKKDVFLNFTSRAVEHQTGIHIDKLEKGCLIFDTRQADGYKVFVVDSNRSNDAQYWRNEFLNVKPASDNYHYTKDFLSITKNYVTKQFTNEFEVSKADQIDLLNRSVDYFKNRDSFDKQEFEEEVFKDSNLIDSFRKFDQSFREENELDLSDSFEISAQAVKKQARVFKSVLKLDKNFHIYIHGNKELIEQGVDEIGRKYYKIYYDEET